MWWDDGLRIQKKNCAPSLGLPFHCKMSDGDRDPNGSNRGVHKSEIVKVIEPAPSNDTDEH